MASPFPFTSGQVLTAAQMNKLGVYFDKASRSTALSHTSSAFTNIDTNLNLTVDAAAGDVISYTFDTYITAGTNIAHFVPYTLDAVGANVNQIPTVVVFGPAIWGTTEVSAKSFTFLYELVAGDIVSDQVTVGLTCNTAGVARSIVDANFGMRVYLTNLGPEVS
jgi:hypothetical protein